MNYAKETSRFTAKSLGDQFKLDLAAAEFEAAVNELVYAFSETIDTNLADL